MLILYSAQKVSYNIFIYILYIIIIIIMVIFKCYFSGELIALTKKQILFKKKEEALFKQTELVKAANSIK